MKGTGNILVRNGNTFNDELAMNFILIFDLYLCNSRYLDVKCTERFKVQVLNQSLQLPQHLYISCTPKDFRNPQEKRNLQR